MAQSTKGQPMCALYLVDALVPWIPKMKWHALY